jgi:hypothetical protein
MFPLLQIVLIYLYLHTEKMSRAWRSIQREEDDEEEQEAQVHHQQIQLQQRIEEAEAMLARL